MTDAGTDFMPELTAVLNPAARQAGPTSSTGPCTLHGSAFPPRPRRRVFTGRPDQVACARRFIARALVGCPAAQDAVLLTSELVTNTLQHTATGTGGDFEVIACHGPGRIRVTVIDDGSPGTPALAPRAALATSGQGLMLVEALAARWGHHGNQRARTVWFELDCR
jgi:serine/threonine-protein kinase RsbW